MRTYVNETEVVRINCEGNGTSLNINIGGLQLEEVNTCCYLVSVTSRDGRCVKEVGLKRRIEMTKEAFNKRRELTSGSLNLTLKKKLVKSLARSVLLYGAETGTLNKDESRRLNE